MSSPLNIKRRRLNDSVAKLSKPFVSPLRPAKSQSAGEKDEGRRVQQQPKSPADAYWPSTYAHGVRVLQAARSTDIHALPPAKSAPVRKQNAYTAFASKRKDPAELQAERAITALELRIRTVKNDIDALHQAARISGSTSDATTQDGVKGIEAISKVWTKAGLIAAYCSIMIMAIVTSLEGQVTLSVAPFVTSAFQTHALLSTVGVVQNVVNGKSPLSPAFQQTYLQFFLSHPTCLPPLFPLSL